MRIWNSTYSVEQPSPFLVCVAGIEVEKPCSPADTIRFQLSQTISQLGSGTWVNLSELKVPMSQQCPSGGKVGDKISPIGTAIFFFFFFFT